MEFPGILIVEDNDDDRYTLELFLEADGHERIACAASGQEALTLLSKDRFSLVLLDMVLPDLNGDVVLSKIKQNPDIRDTPVIMISGNTETDQVSRCIELGADDYLPKPFNSTILRARIAASFRRDSQRVLEHRYVDKIEQAKKQSDRLLRDIFPPEISARLRSGETNIADQFDQATVLFADIVGFGKITARMKPYEVVGCLNDLFSEFDRLSEQAGIEKIKTIGDKYMAVAGVPAPRPDHARAATELALAFMATTQRLAPRLPVPITIRAGVHSGPVTAGVIGTRRLTYDVWGDTVNMAARIEAESRPGGVLVSHTTLGLIGEGLRTDGPHAITTKEQRTLQTYFVESAGARVG